MSSNVDHLFYRNLQKIQFIGYFQLCEMENTESCIDLLDTIEESGIGGLAYSLIMGFSEAQTKVEYGFARVEPKNVPSLFERGERKKGDPNSISLSMVFSGLEEPGEFSMFAQRFGSLFGFESNPVEDRICKHATAQALASAFDRKPTEGEIGKLAALQKEVGGGLESADRYEYAEDWLTASRLMRKAFLFRELLVEDFTIDKTYPYDGIVEFALRDSEGTDVLRVIRDGSFIMLPLEGVTGDNDYIKRCFHDRPHIGEGFERFDDELGVMMRRLDSGTVVLACEEPTTSSDKGAIARVLQRSLEYLVHAHRVNAGFSFHGGVAFYDFDSLLSFLWFDFVMVATGAKRFSACKSCGRPFFASGQGPKRKYCDGACRQAAGRKKKKEKSE